MHTCVDNLGAYVRAPEPATTYRPLGNYVGPYRVRDVELHLVDVVSNKAPTGPNRGYGCQQVYLETERTLDRLRSSSASTPPRSAAEPDPRRRVPVRDADRRRLRQRRLPARARARSRDRPVQRAARDAGGARDEGRLVGIGIGLAVDPSVSNMGYITVALPPEVRQAPGYNPKSGAADWAQVRVSSSGKVVVTMGTAPQGQGHETAVAQVVADELGLTPDDVATVDAFDSHTSVWSVSSGSYSSRFAGIAAGCRAEGVRRGQASRSSRSPHRCSRRPPTTSSSWTARYV